jgi:phenylpyruvate tautomerase PptA (4-oxalocrotonate tautomerase family)
MPMIDFTFPAGALDAETKAGLVEELATTLLRAERAPDTEFFRSITWVYAHEVPADALFVGGRPGGEPRFRIEVKIPEGALSDRRKAELVAGFNEVVSRAAGLSEEDGLRVWTLINEVTDGNWGAAGQVIRFAQLVEMAKGEREKTDAPEPAPAAAG